MPLVNEAAARHGALVLDFSAVEYISSVGLRVLMVAAKQMREHQAQLLVASLQSVVAEIIAISRFDRILTVTATVDDALAAVLARRTPERRPDAGDMTRVRFWGTRGSLPVALTAADVCQKLLATLRAARGQPLADERDLEALLAKLPFAVSGTYGGHSSCVQIETASADHFVCDMGSGLRPFGQAATARRGGGAQTFHIFMSHLHWDHIMGLPFFLPAFIPGNRVVIYGSHPHLESALRRQQEPRRSRSTSRSSARRWSSCTSSPTCATRSPASASPRCCSATAATRTGTASSPRARSSSTRPTPSTRSRRTSTPRASSASSATPTW